MCLGSLDPYDMPIFANARKAANDAVRAAASRNVRFFVLPPNLPLPIPLRRRLPPLSALPPIPPPHPPPPATSAPATSAPAPSAPAPSAPAPSAPATSATATPALATPAPATPALATLAPATSAPATSAPAPRTRTRYRYRYYKHATMFERDRAFTSDSRPFYVRLGLANFTCIFFEEHENVQRAEYAALLYQKQRLQDEHVVLSGRYGFFRPIAVTINHQWLVDKWVEITREVGELLGTFERCGGRVEDVDGVKVVSETGLVRIVEAKMKIQMLRDELEQYHLLEQRLELAQSQGFGDPR